MFNIKYLFALQTLFKIFTEVDLGLIQRSKIVNGF